MPPRKPNVAGSTRRCGGPDGAVDKGRWALDQDGDLSLQLDVLLGHDIHLVPHADHFLIKRSHLRRDRVLGVCQGRLDHTKASERP